MDDEIEQADRAEVDLIESNIDAQYYASQTGLKADARGCALHYILHGASSGLSPRMDFDTDFYLETCRDVATSGINPFYHFLAWGRREGRLGHRGGPENPLSDADQELLDIVQTGFDATYYWNAYSGSVDSSVNLARHYSFYGWRLGFNPNSEFDTRFYLSSNEDVAAAQINPFYHYIKWGRFEGRRANASDLKNYEHADTKLVAPHFDVDFYRATYLSEVVSDLDPLQHFLYFGWRQGFDPNANFSTNDYMAANADVDFEKDSPFVRFLKIEQRHALATAEATADVEAIIRESGLFDESWYRTAHDINLQDGGSYLQHYLALGEAANLKPNPIFDPAWYRLNYMNGDGEANALYHFITVGKKEASDPSDSFSTEAYFDSYRSVKDAGMIALRHYLEHGIRAGLAISPSKLARRTYHDVIADNTSHLRALRVFVTRGSQRPCVNMVTDSVNKGSLFGGVGTAIILSALLAERRGQDLCIMTTAERPHAPAIERLLRANSLNYNGRLIFKHVGLGHSGSSFDVDQDDLFLTTSWWTTASTSKSVPSEQIVYLLQEDERMFYDFGDNRLRCSELLARQDLRKIINTKLLHDHLSQSGLSGIPEQSCWFEPAFPTAARRSIRARAMMNLFFYARPNNHRNLFTRSLEVLERAVMEGSLDASRWRLHVVGKDTPKPFPTIGLQTTVHSGLDWEAYAALMSDMDLGLSLMYTPHPSYPPLDLIAHGGVCVTNRFGLKQDLSRYSKNIICADTDVDALASAMRRGAELAANLPLRIENFESQQIGTDWREAFKGVFDFIDARRP